MPSDDDFGGLGFVFTGFIEVGFVAFAIVVVTVVVNVVVDDLAILVNDGGETFCAPSVDDDDDFGGVVTLGFFISTLAWLSELEARLR